MIIPSASQVKNADNINVLSILRIIIGTVSIPAAIKPRLSENKNVIHKGAPVLVFILLDGLPDAL